MRQRNHALTLRLNDEELKHLKDQVVASGLTTQTFLRLLIVGQKIEPRRPEVFIDLLHELSAIGNNINQIARVANTCGYVRQSDLNEIKEMQSRIWQKVKWMQPANRKCIRGIVKADLTFSLLFSFFCLWIWCFVI